MDTSTGLKVLDLDSDLGLGSLNPGLGSMNPGLGSMNPGLGSMNPDLGSVYPGHGTIVTEVPLVERSQAVSVGSNPCPMFDRRVLMHRWWLSMEAYQQVTDDLVISPLCLRQTEATPGGWRGEALTASRSARSSYLEYQSKTQSWVRNLRMPNHGRGHDHRSRCTVYSADLPADAKSWARPRSSDKAYGVQR